MQGGQVDFFQEGTHGLDPRQSCGGIGKRLDASAKCAVLLGHSLRLSACVDAKGIFDSIPEQIGSHPRSTFDGLRHKETLTYELFAFLASGVTNRGYPSALRVDFQNEGNLFFFEAGSR